MWEIKKYIWKFNVKNPEKYRIVHTKKFKDFKINKIKIPGR